MASKNKVKFDLKKFFGIKANNLRGYPNEDLFPYTCYYNNTTIITQNAQLIKVIKIPSYLKNDDVNIYTLREKINGALYKCVDEPNVNFTINLIRKSIDIVPQNQTYDNNFAKYIVNKWNKTNDFANEYINEIYISIIYCLPSWHSGNKMTDILRFKNFTMLKRKKLIDFKKMEATLSNIANSIVNDLKEYKPSILSIVKNEDGYYYSEHCKFFSQIINGVNALFPLDVYSLGYGLGYKKVKYGTNLIELQDEEKNESNFVSVITLKDFSGILLSELDKIIQVHQNLVITQTISVDDKISNYELDLKETYNQYALVDENTLSNVLNLTDLIEECEEIKEKIYNYFISQVTIQVRGKTKEELEKHITELIKILKNLGLVCVREDVFLPTIFWSQLPGNFEFIKRQKIINRREIGALTSLCNFPTGRLVNNKWGDALILLKTALKNPYFFSFHSNNGGNTLIVGPREEERTKLLNFLILASTKQAKKIFYFDTIGKANVLINALNGNYYQYTLGDETKKQLSINIFNLEKSEENKKFLLDMITKIIQFTEDGMVKLGANKTSLQNELKKFVPIFNEKYNEVNNFKDFLLLMRDNNCVNIYNFFFKFYSNKNENFGFIFNNANGKNIDFSNNINGFDLSLTVENPLVMYITTNYLLQKIYNENKNCEPTIIATDEIWNLIDNQYYSDSFYDLIKKFKERNIIFVATTAGSRFFENSFVKTEAISSFPTTILLRNMKANIYQKKIFNISTQEAKMISVIKKDSGMFLIRHNKDMIFASINFDFLTKSEKAILESDNIIVNAMKKAKKNVNSEDSSIWIPEMQDIIDAYNKNKTNQKLKEQEERQIKWQESREQVNMEQINGTAK